MLICLFRRVSFVVAGLVLSALPGLSHEFWIEPQKYQVESGAPVIANLRNGQNFSGANQVYFARRTHRFETMQAGQTAPYQGRMGDLPAFHLDKADEGLLIIIHETAPQTITYETWEKFQAFADHKGFAKIGLLHQERGLPSRDFSETYTRHAKTLVAIGIGSGKDQLLGMETEIVALANPYTDDLTDGFPVQIFDNGHHRADTQIEVFERAADNTVTVFLIHTDQRGLAVIPVKPGHSYLLDAVVLRPAPATSESVWETLWASLTFATP